MYGVLRRIRTELEDRVLESHHLDFHWGMEKARAVLNYHWLKAWLTVTAQAPIQNTFLRACAQTERERETHTHTHKEREGERRGEKGHKPGPIFSLAPQSFDCSTQLRAFCPKIPSRFFSDSHLVKSFHTHHFTMAPKAAGSAKKAPAHPKYSALVAEVCVPCFASSPSLSKVLSSSSCFCFCCASV